MMLVVQEGIRGFLRKKYNPPNLAELYRSSHKLVFTHDRGEQIYNFLKEELAQHLRQKVRENVLNSFNQKFHKTLDKAWSDHQTAMTMIRDILMPLETIYIPKSDVDTIKCVCWIVFRDEIVLFEPIREHLRETLLTMISDQRESKSIDQNLIQTACQMLLTLGLGERWVYEEVFVRPYLAQLNEFKEQLKIDDEIERTKMYLDEATIELVVETFKSNKT